VDERPIGKTSKINPARSAEKNFLKMEETKRCPFCDNEIKLKAKKCQFCGEWLTAAPSVSLTGVDLVKQALGDRYEIQEEIGRGGMATVYRAVQKSLDRTVALKVVHQNLLHDSEFVARFHREAKLCASLNHPNIVHVYDEGEVSGVHFMAMEYLEGQDLRHLIRSRGKLTPEQTLQYLLPVAEALDYAHGRGLIHRDIKSANIFICNNPATERSRSARIVLMDFGIAHAAAGTQLTKAGTVIGTPEYMSPEQADGRAVDHRTDLYSLGVVMYECLTGRVPFTSDNAVSTIYKVLNEQPDEAAFGNITYRVKVLAMSLLSKNPANRPASGAKTAEAIRLLQQGKEWQPPAPVQAAPKPTAAPKPAAAPGETIKLSGTPPPRPKPKAPPQKKNVSPQVWAMGAIGVILIATLLAVLLQPPQRPGQPETAKIETPAPQAAQPLIDTKDENAWQQADGSGTLAAYNKYLELFPKGHYAVEAAGKVEQLKAEEESRRKAAEAEKKRQAERDRLAAEKRDEEAWKLAQNTNTPSGYAGYLKNPKGKYRTQAKAKKDELEAKEKQEREAREKDLAAWQAAQSANTIAAYDQYLRHYPDGEYAGQARTNKAALEEAARLADPFHDQMVFVKGGTFTMGCTAEQSNCASDEKPAHQVTVSDYFIGKYEVTQKQWREVMGTTVSQQRDKANTSWPLQGEGDNYPMYYVSWDEVQEFIKKLNQKTGKKYRLPTEAEWEYAARGGSAGSPTRYSGSNNIDEVAWYTSNSGSKTNPVGRKKPNELGIYDMSGNVWEWCEDDWHDNYNGAPTDGRAWIDSPRSNRRLLRGGSWYLLARHCRVSGRYRGSPDDRYSVFGFRLAQDF
jgi:formylglycine-generating enzyme required for sulfatase activity/serine/threonine protein kinase